MSAETGEGFVPPQTLRTPDIASRFRRRLSLRVAWSPQQPWGAFRWRVARAAASRRALGGALANGDCGRQACGGIWRSSWTARGATLRRTPATTREPASRAIPCRARRGAGRAGDRCGASSAFQIRPARSWGDFLPGHCTDHAECTPKGRCDGDRRQYSAVPRPHRRGLAGNASLSSVDVQPSRPRGSATWSTPSSPVRIGRATSPSVSSCGSALARRPPLLVTRLARSTSAERTDHTIEHQARRETSSPRRVRLPASSARTRTGPRDQASDESSSASSLASPALTAASSPHPGNGPDG
jgi:hypothetical protein